jgi:hypothetical protein
MPPSFSNEYLFFLIVLSAFVIILPPAPANGQVLEKGTGDLVPDFIAAGRE